MTRKQPPAPAALGTRIVPRGTAIAYTAADGSQRELVADAEGRITPETAQDAEVIDGFEFEPEPPAADPAATDKPDTGEEG